MTLKRSFIDGKLFCHNLKQNIWAFALSMISLIAVYPIFVGLSIQNLQTYGNDADKYSDSAISDIASALGCENIPAKLVIIVLAIILGIAMFRYLHVKTQIDFYHSLPITRKQLFVHNYLTGFTIFMVSYVVLHALAVIIAYTAGYGSSISQAYLPQSILSNIVYFLWIYTLTILCMTLCGNTVVSLLLLGWALFSIAAAQAMLTSYGNFFFDTYAASDEILWSYSISSPIFSYFIANWADVPRSLFSNPNFHLIFGIIITIILFIATFILFSRRKSERTGNAIAFPQIQLPLKLWCVFVMALLGGILPHALLYHERSFTWLYIGFAIFAFLTHCLMEMIFNLDFKAALKHIKTFAVFAAACAVGFAGAQMDILGYDDYMPSAEDVSAIYIEGLNYSNQELIMMDACQWYAHSDAEKNMRLLESRPNIETILELVALARQNEQAESANNDSSEVLYYGFIEVRYYLQDGRTKDRGYRIPYTRQASDSANITQTINSLIAQVYYSSEFQMKHNVLFTRPDDICVLYLHNNTSIDGGISMTQNPEAISNIVSALQKELLTITPEKVANELPVMALSVQLGYNKQMGSSVRPAAAYADATLPVYANFIETLAAIKQASDIQPTSFADNEWASASITITEYDDNHSNIGEGQVTITDPDDIKALAENAVSNEFFANYSGTSYAYTDNKNIMILFCSKGGALVQARYLKDDLPLDIIRKYEGDAIITYYD